MTRSRVLSAFAVLVLILPSTAAANDRGDDPASRLVSNEEAASVDVAAYADSFRVDVAAAKIQLAEVDAIAALQARLEKEFPDTFGGLWIEHEPYGVVVTGTAGAAKGIAALASGAPLSVKPEYRVVARSYSDLLKLGSQLAGADLGAVNLAVNIITNTVDVETTAKEAVEVSLSRARVESPAIRVLQMPSIGGPSVNIFGGLGGANHLWSGCMSAFTVQRTITAGVIESGIVTAGHCGNTLSYQNVNLPLVSDWHQTNADAQWHTTPTFTDQPEFIFNALQDRRFVTGTKTRANMVVGASVCKYGVVTGYGCGTIDIKDFRPNPLDSNWVSNPSFTFIRAQNCNSTLSQPGDSGGPIFLNNTAYGVMSGHEIDVFCGGRSKMIFTAIDLALSHFGGVTVKIH
jgi:streptogrisin C